jgi:hypothetical protein
MRNSCKLTHTLMALLALFVMSAVARAADPGTTYPPGAPVSDQKAGSVLIYNVYTSNIAAPNTSNTRVNITNTSSTTVANVHIFFLDGATCSIADSFICLTPNQTASFLASDVDPGTTGYIFAVATNDAGCPVNFNWLIGDAYVKFASGHAANLTAEAFSAVFGPALVTPPSGIGTVPGPLPGCTADSITAVLAFNDVQYNAAPRVLAASNIPSRGDGNDTKVIIDRIGGSLATGVGGIGSLFGLLYDDAENPLSFTFNAANCQFNQSLGTGTFPRTAPPFANFIPPGRSGWLKIYSLSDVAIVGSTINFNPNAGTASNAFNGGHNMHKLTLTTGASVTIPVFPSNCGF